jgi:hypothetical protein
MELSCEQLDNHLKDTQLEKHRLQEHNMLIQHKLQNTEEELTQTRAHADLYRIQLEETAQDRDLIKVPILNGQ